MLWPNDCANKELRPKKSAASLDIVAASLWATIFGIALRALEKLRNSQFWICCETPRSRRHLRTAEKGQWSRLLQGGPRSEAVRRRFWVKGATRNQTART